MAEVGRGREAHEQCDGRAALIPEQQEGLVAVMSPQHRPQALTKRGVGCVSLVGFGWVRGWVGKCVSGLFGLIVVFAMFVMFVMFVVFLLFVLFVVVFMVEVGAEIGCNCIQCSCARPPNLIVYYARNSRQLAAAE